MKLRIDGGEKKVVNVEFDEGNDNNGGVSNKKKSKKCRIHKVKYMNSKIGEMFDKDELGIDSNSGGENEYDDEDSETPTPSYFFPFLVNFPSFFTFFFRDLSTIPPASLLPLQTRNFNFIILTIFIIILILTITITI